MFGRKSLATVALGGALSIAALACGTDEPGAPASGELDSDGVVPTPPPAASLQPGYDAVRQSLQAKGALVVRASEEREGVFKNPVTNVLINGETVAVYEFPSTDEADAASITISDDGSTVSDSTDPPIAIDYQYAPHYFKQGNVIVVYTGNDASTISLLRDTLGEEFAGDSGPVTEPGPGFDFDTVIAPAPIDSVEVREDPDKPGHFILYVTSGLPSGCASFHDWSIEQTGELELTLEVLNNVPAPDQMIACTEIYGFKNHAIPLGSADTNLDACEVYKVRWQTRDSEESLRFQVTAPNVRCMSPEPPINNPDTGGHGPIVHPIISDLDALILALQNAGVDIVRIDKKGSEFFGVTSQVLLVHGERVEIFSFGRGDEAMRVAHRVSVDGIDAWSSDINWASTPNLYLSGTSIVLYVGENDKVIETLESTAGLKFAGPGSKPVILPEPGSPAEHPTTPVAPDAFPTVGGSGATPGEPGDGMDPSPAFPDLETVLVPAPIVSVGEVMATKSLPPQYFVQVRSAQSNGCEQDAGWEVKVDGTDVHISVSNSQPENMAVVLCLMIYGETEHTVALGSEGFESGVEYKLIVNGEEHGNFTGM